MKIVVILQIITIVSLFIILVRSIAEMHGPPVIYEGNSYDNESQLSIRVFFVGDGVRKKENNRKKIMANDQLRLAKGTYCYLGNRMCYLFYPDYIRIKRGYFPKPLELLIGVREDGIEISVLKGTIETSFRQEPYHADKKTWIFIPKKDYFETNGYRFFVE